MGVSRAARRRFSHPGLERGAETGRGLVDRGRTGSKHHLITDAPGIPLAPTLTGGNRNDVPPAPVRPRRPAAAPDRVARVAGHRPHPPRLPSCEPKVIDARGTAAELNVLVAERPGSSRPRRLAARPVGWPSPPTSPGTSRPSATSRTRADRPSARRRRPGRRRSGWSRPASSRPPMSRPAARSCPLRILAPCSVPASESTGADQAAAAAPHRAGAPPAHDPARRVRGARPDSRAPSSGLQSLPGASKGKPGCLKTCARCRRSLTQSLSTQVGDASWALSLGSS